MGRREGSNNRHPRNSCKALRALLRKLKEERCKSEGCAWCPTPVKDPDPSPSSMTWYHVGPEGSQEFVLTKGPDMAGMTQERLLNAASKCVLVCRRCLSRYHTNAPRRPAKVEEEVRDGGRVEVLDFWMGGSTVAQGVVDPDPPDFVSVGGVLFRRVEPPQ